MSSRLLLLLMLFVPPGGCPAYLGYGIVNLEAVAQTEELVRTGLPQNGLIDAAAGF